MRQYTIIAHIISRRDNLMDSPVGWGIEMPVGSQPCGVQMVPHGPESAPAMALMALADPKAPRVWHPLILTAVRQVTELPLGRVAGAYLGGIQLQGGMRFLFREDPWPTSSIEVAHTIGRA